jgi:hypothetical protein
MKQLLLKRSLSGDLKINSLIFKIYFLVDGHQSQAIHLGSRTPTLISTPVFPSTMESLQQVEPMARSI